MNTSQRVDMPNHERHVNGLQSPAEIFLDFYGVCHIYAQSTQDVFFVQGYNAARDRLWQIDTWRRRGLGRLSEVFGPEYLERDRAARLFLYRGDMRAEWLAYGSDTKEIATTFVDGINAYVEHVRETPGDLPLEFAANDYLPSYWEPEDLTRIRSHGLFNNLREEVKRAFTLRDHGAAVEELRKVREPEVSLDVPEGLKVEVIPDNVLDVYELATTTPDFADPTEVPSSSAVQIEGSNNWVVGGSRTATGRPLLANDPHRALTLPSLRYIVHLSTPKFDIIGGGEPALPGISLGHNGELAFGMTLFPIDQEDLYIYELNPQNPNEYKYRDEWETIQRSKQLIDVKGSAAATAVELAFTRHGPVIASTDTHCFAVRAAWLEPGMAPYLGSIDYMRASDVESFSAAMNRWGAPPENQIYADTSGNIGWKAAGLTPRRPNWNGMLPVPGDGRFEWDGFYYADVLPSESNPRQDWLATANEMNLPPGHPETVTVTHDWFSPDRKKRIDETLRASDSHSIASSALLQDDVVSLPARVILQKLSELDVEKPEVALRMLREWDGNLEADSPAGALFEVWHRQLLRPALIEAVLERQSVRTPADKIVGDILPEESLLADSRVLMNIVQRPDVYLGEDHVRLLQNIVEQTLEAAFAECTRLLGDDLTAWRWGELHTAILKHPLHKRNQELGSKTVLGPVPRGGSGDTVCDTAYDQNYVQTGGSTFRLIIDVGAWDNSIALNSPGQSGDLRSDHYDDLLEPWSKGEYFPLLYSREAIEAHAECVWHLKPEKTPPQG